MGIQIQPASLAVFHDKYAKDGERTAVEVFARVAHALAAVEQDPKTWETRFLGAMQAGFLPAGRVLSAAGTAIQATLINCFVQPIGDSTLGNEDAKPGIMQALADAAETMRRGGGVGYNFSALRPAGALVSGTHSRASGPIPFMELFDAMCQTVESAGSRRGAQMGILNCDHPDIEAFVAAKAKPYADKALKHFNISVAVSDRFMQAVEHDEPWHLVHQASPFDPAAHVRNAHGDWIYKTVQARELWQDIMRATYDYADPGVVFVDHFNRDNNLAYAEHIDCTNPCGEQPLPPNGCCCLGSIKLSAFVREPFSPNAHFDFAGLDALVALAVRMLDNVLDITYWPLPQQRAEAHSKRRVGLGFLALADCLIMLGLRYDSAAARELTARIAQHMRDAAYRASQALAEEKGAFPLFDAEPYLASGFASRLPEELRAGIRQHGLRNSHLLSIAPTGTLSVSLGNNCSSGIEPVFALLSHRRIRQADGSFKTVTIADDALLQYLARNGDDTPSDERLLEAVDQLSGPWTATAEAIAPADHLAMVAAVAPYVDSAISKTINVPSTIPFTDFEHIYTQAWRLSLKGVTTFRANPQQESVLSDATKSVAATLIEDLDQTDPDRLVRLDRVPELTLASLRWRKRPRPHGGNPSWTYFVDHPGGNNWAITVGHIQADDGNHPFEVWVTGEAPRGLGALAKSLSMDMRSDDRAWLAMKLETLRRIPGDDGFLVVMPDGQPRHFPSQVAAFAGLVEWRALELEALTARAGEQPLVDALLSRKEPKAGTDGTLSWTVDVVNPQTGDDFVLGLKELALPDGSRRPYAVWLAGGYPRSLDGLCKALSLDLRVADVAWGAAKLRQLLDFAEALGDFMAKEPGSRKSHTYPSTVAYIARLIIHRFAMLGLLDEDGTPLEVSGALAFDEPHGSGQLTLDTTAQPAARGYKPCPECAGFSLIRKDGCDYCTQCGYLGSCG